MKNANTVLVLFLALCFISASDVFAQSSIPEQRAQSDQERMIQELINEVRELRTIVQRIDENVRTKITHDRLQAHQGQLSSLTRDRINIQEKLVEVRTRKRLLELKIPELIQQLSTGVKPALELQNANTELDQINQLEQHLLQRESQLSAEITAVRATLTNLEAENTKPPARKQ
jgi:predicted  nucleic acid-binding Zn-ribbon protein